MLLPKPGARDLRLDLFRGLALWLIFLDHIPSNMVSWITIRNYGFSDATEIFVFISGYTAAFVYGRAMREHGPVVASARILKRAWQVYVAHVFLFAIYMAEISYVSASFENPLYGEEMGIFDFLRQPDVTLVQALMLKFKPANMNVLPLYIVLLAGFPLALPGLLRWPYFVIGLSLVVYAVTLHFDWNLPGYPDDKVWYFNPMAWQVVFYSGAVLAVVAPDLARLDRWRRLITVLAVLYLLFAAFIALSWQYNSLERLVPDWLARQIYPIDKTNLDVLRFVHFLSLAWLVRLMVRPNARFLKWRLSEPIRRCGEHSLQIFCLGTFLAVTAQIIVARYEDSIVSQLAVSLTGLVIMCLAAYGASWFKAGPPARGFVA